MAGSHLSFGCCCSWSRPPGGLYLACPRVLAGARNFPEEVTLPTVTHGRRQKQSQKCFWVNNSALVTCLESSAFLFLLKKTESSQQNQILLSWRSLVNSFTTEHPESLWSTKKTKKLYYLLAVFRNQLLPLDRRKILHSCRVQCTCSQSGRGISCGHSGIHYPSFVWVPPSPQNLHNVFFMQQIDQREFSFVGQAWK